MRVHLHWTTWLLALASIGGAGCQCCPSPCPPVDGCAACYSSGPALGFLPPHPLTLPTMAPAVAGAQPRRAVAVVGVLASR